MYTIWCFLQHTSSHVAFFFFANIFLVPNYESLIFFFLLHIIWLDLWQRIRSKLDLWPGFLLRSTFHLFTFVQHFLWSKFNWYKRSLNDQFSKQLAATESQQKERCENVFRRGSDKCSAAYLWCTKSASQLYSNQESSLLWTNYTVFT